MRAALLLALLPLAALAAPPYLGKPVRVFLLAGQSNMAGSGAVNRAPPAWRNQPEVLFDATTAGDASTVSSTWQTLGTAEPGMGPEIAFGALLAQASPDHQIALVKVSRAATGLGYWGTPGNAGHDALMSRIDTAAAWLDAAVAAGSIPSWSFDGFLWFQGENEADGALSPSTTYAADFTDLVTRVRTRAGSPALPVVLGRISILLDPALGGPVNQPQLDNVRAAQVAWADARPEAAWIDTDDLTLVDAFHFGSAGQLAIGRRFARAYLDLTDPRPSATVERAPGQADRAHGSNVRFHAVFPRPVASLPPASVSVATETGPGTTVATAPVAPFDGTRWLIRVSGMQHPGLVTVSLPAGAAADTNGLPSLPSIDEANTVLWSPHAGVADLIVHDPLETSPAPLLNTTTGRGWSGTGWLVQNNRTGYRADTATPLTYPGLASSPGGAVGGDTFVTAARELDLENTARPWMTSRSAGALDAPGSELWFSWLVRPLRDGREQRVALARGTGTGGSNQTVSVHNASGVWQFTVLGTTLPTGIAATTGATHLLVLRLTIGGPSSPSTARLWINPASALLGGAPPPLETAVASHEVQSADFKFSRVFWYPGSSAADGAVDELRLGTTFASVTPTAAAAPDAEPASFTAWKALHFSGAQLGDASVSGMFASPLGDGVPNLLKHVLGAGPFETVRVLAPVSGPADAVPTFAFAVHASAPDIDLVVESSFDLASWTPLPSARVVTLAGTSATPPLRMYRVTPPVGAAPAPWFVRLRAP